MSEFAVYRTLGNGRCLVLDGTRIAGGKPDYRGNNYITSWVTSKTYGPVDELKSENVKLRELAKGYEALTATLCNERECDGCPFDDPERIVCEHMSLQTCLAELGVEVDG